MFTTKLWDFVGYASSLGGGSIYAVGEVIGVQVWVKLQGMPVLWKALAPELTKVSFGALL